MYGGSPDRDGISRVRSSSSGDSAESRTLPCEVCGAGNTVPMSTRNVMIFGTETRAT